MHICFRAPPQAGKCGGKLLIGAQDQGTAQRFLRHWPEGLFNIAANYITMETEINSFKYKKGNQLFNII